MADRPRRRTLWDGRLEAPPSERAREYTRSIDVDLRLLPYELEASRAHASVLRAANLLDETAHAAVLRGLARIGEEHEAGKFDVEAFDEDVHSAVERRLHDLIGEAALRLHAGRSRNDQVATDLRLYTRRAVSELNDALSELAEVLADVSRRHEHDAMPGYTHLQRAQPVTLGRHLAAYVEMFGRDRARLDGALERLMVLPLGSGALAGSTLGLDPTIAAQELGFHAVAANPLDAVGDRDFVMETVSACAILMVHCSRLCEDVVLWSSTEFGFLHVADAHATGSSIMPQKRNPDVAELGRGRSARVIGDAVSVLTLLKGLPLTYNRDLQEDKRPLYDAIDTSRDTVRALAELIAAARFDVERMRGAASDPALLATDIAELLVTRGVPFRDAHAVVAAMVRRAESSGRSLAEFTASEWDEVTPALGADIVAIFDVDASLRRRGM